MIKKISKFISLTLIFCMFMPIAVLAEESATIRNITYEEWVAEQNGIDSSYEAVQSDMEPVNISVDRQEQNDFRVQTIYREGISGNKSLDSILKGKGKYELDGEVNLAAKEESVISSIKENVEQINDESLANNTISGNIVESEDNGSRMDDSGLARTAPTAGLIPIIINEDSSVNGQLTTETVIAFLYDDADSDGDTIVGRYVDGSAVDFILGEIDGGFVMQITEPGTYLLIYQVEDSAGELHLSYVERWRMKAPNSSAWVNNKSSFWYIIDMNYKVDASNNVRLKGTWSSALEPSSAGRGGTFTPRYSFYYDYEYGD